MSLTKDLYHDDIVSSAEDTDYNHAAEEYSAEERARVKRITEFISTIDRISNDPQAVVNLASKFVREDL
jgi:hypothetical protein